VVIQIDRKFDRGSGMAVAAHLEMILLKGRAVVEENKNARQRTGGPRLLQHIG
jgi:hypothetical protein